MVQLLSDLKGAYRQFAKNPGFTAVAVLTLALGIGVNTAMFSVVYGILIDPYPYARSGEIWAPYLKHEGPGGGSSIDVLADAVEVRKLPAIADVAATWWDSQVLSGGENPEVLNGIIVTGNAFSFLGVPPLLGRGLVPSDIRPNGDRQPVVVLAYQLWQRLFGGDPAAVGKTLMLNGQRHVIVGVMPPRFGWYTNDLWLPMPTVHPGTQRVRYIVRLRPGVSPQEAEQQMQALNLALAKERPDNFPKGSFTTHLANYLDTTSASGTMEASLHLLFWAVGFLLLIACANVANLQLARATGRAREIAIRLAVGAGRGRLIRQLLTESVLLSSLGGALGVGLAFAVIKIIVVLMPGDNVPNEARVALNGYALAFLAGISVLSGIVFGLIPALRSTQLDVFETLKDGSQGAGASRSGGRIRGVLIVTEVALSVILLVGACLTIRGFIDLQRVDLGFQPDHVLMLGVSQSEQRYPTYAKRIDFDQELLDRVRNLPGVVSSAWANNGVPFGGWRTRFAINGQPKDPSQQIVYDLVSSDFRQTMGMRLLSGRDLTEAEVAHGDAVGLISEAAAKLWPAGTSPLGQELTLDELANVTSKSVLAPPSAGKGAMTVIGIVGDVRREDDRDAPSPAIYIPYTWRAPPTRMLVLRTSGPPLGALNLVRREVKALDPDQALKRPETAEEAVGYATLQPRFNMVLFTVLAAIGLMLAIVGIYSSLSYHVAQRTREIGVRIALGAESKDVIGMVLMSGTKLLALGLVIGLGGSIALARLLNSRVFLVPATDPLALLGAALLISIAAIFACWLPASRAANVDPVVALRAE